MKRFYIRYIIIVCSLLLGKADIFAALTTNGTWSATTISADETVNLTGDINVKGMITINKNCTLTIKSPVSRTIKNTGISDTGDDYLRYRMFKVLPTATLIIEGSSEDEPIIIDGGANFSWGYQNGDSTLIKGSGSKTLNDAIINYGNMVLRNVKIQNVNDVNINGGAIHIQEASNGVNGTTLLDHCTIENCKSQIGAALLIGKQGTSINPEDCKITITDSKITHCISGGGSQQNPGGAIRTYGNAVANLYLTRVQFKYNYGRHGTHATSPNVAGGALFWNAHGSDVAESVCYIDGCTFEHNHSDDLGGAISSQGSIVFRNNPTTIQYNQARMGAGMNIQGYSGEANDNEEASYINYDLNENLIIKNNTTLQSGNNLRGAGIYFLFPSSMSLNDNSQITVNLVGATITNNKANDFGGGIYFENSTTNKTYTITVNLNYGNVHNNEAEYGGGIYINKGIVSSSLFEGKSLSIKNNKANIDGGGLYITNGGSFNMSSGEISNNSTTSGNGGGVFMQDGSVTITNGTIKNNISANYGGGLYVYNSYSTKKIASFNGGNIVNNQAKAGGGICTNGNVELTIGNVHVEDNIAINGGGLCLLGGASMDFGAGLIRFNNATQKDNTPFITAKEETINNIQGVGGGVYLDSNSSLTFSSLQMGLYGNIADRAADDIFANGSGTAVTLPDVTTMNLADYPSAGTLYWVEDYVTEDTGYSRISYEDQPSDYSPIRYRVALENSADIYRVSDGIYENKYVCLALGYRNLFATILKTGLKEGESAIFEVYKKMSDESYAYNTTILLTGQKGQTSVSKEFTVSEGFWKVVETNWSWGYDLTNPTSPERSIIKEITDTEGTDKTFYFINTAKEIPPVKYDEDIKVNIMNL